MKQKLILAIFILSLVFLSACRNETQNQIRRSIQDFTNTKMYITLYSLDGVAIYEGVVDGKVTRSSANLGNTNEGAGGSYIYWYDDKGEYHQTDLPYLVSTISSE